MSNEQELLVKNFQQAKSIAEKQLCTINNDYKLKYNGLEYNPEITFNHENPRFDLLNVKYQVDINTTIELNITSLK
jgi:hypothetical protein